MIHERKKNPTNQPTNKKNPKQLKKSKGSNNTSNVYYLIFLLLSASVSQRGQIQQGLLCLWNSSFLNLVFIRLSGKLYNVRQLFCLVLPNTMLWLLELESWCKSKFYWKYDLIRSTYFLGSHLSLLALKVWLRQQTKKNKDMNKYLTSSMP